MKILNQTIVALIIITVVACEKDTVTTHKKSEELVGSSWINPTLNDTIWTFEKTTKLKENEYGFSFQSDLVFIEKKNSGWCGTPPISYADFEGTWKLNDSLIDISVGYWGGVSEYQWKILSIDNQKLIVYKQREEYYFEE